MRHRTTTPRLTSGWATLWALVATLTAWPAAAPPPQQTPPPTPPPPQNPAPAAPQQPTFRVRIDSVSVDVIVTDRQGNPVPDLTAEDFEIREAGKVQKIDTFKFIHADDSQDASPPREIQSFEDQRRETAIETNRLFVIFLDDYHVRRGNAMRVRQDLARFVSNQMSPRDLVAIMYPLLPPTAITFSRNHDGTAVEIMAFEGRKYDYTPRNQIEARYQMMIPEAQEAIRNETTLSALENLCVFLGSLRDGRKTILFVSEGLSSTIPTGARTTGSIVSTPVPTTPQQNMSAMSDLFTQMQDVFIQAARANTAIYTLDPRGLAGSEFGVEDRVDQAADRAALNESMDSLRSLAGETDGRAIVGRNNPEPELQKMRRDLSAYYLLSYTSSVAPRDGKFHQIDVRLKNRRGLEVRARKGYWAYSAADYERATAPPKPLPPRDVSDALETLAALTEPSARRPVSLYLGAVRGVKDNALVTFAWESTASIGTPADEVADRVNVVVHSIYGDVLFKGPVPRAEGGSPPGGRITFEAPVGAVRVQTVAENARGSRLDSDTVTLDVPDFKGGELAISTPMLFRGRTVRDLQQLRALAAPRPTAVRAFSRTERLLLRFDVYGPAGSPPAVTMRVLNNAGNQLAALPAPTKTDTGYESEFGLNAFPPGEYLVEISLKAGEKSMRYLLGLRVTG